MLTGAKCERHEWILAALHWRSSTDVKKFKVVGADCLKGNGSVCFPCCVGHQLPARLGYRNMSPINYLRGWDIGIWVPSIAPKPYNDHHQWSHLNFQIICKLMQILCKFNLFMEYKNIHEKVVLDIPFIHTTYRVFFYIHPF